MDNIQGFISLNIYALIVIFITAMIFFNKKRLRQVEDKTYSVFLIFNILSTFLGIILGLIILPSLEINILIIKIFNKLYLFSLIIWGSILTYYTGYISNIKHKNNIKNYKLYKKYSLIILTIVEIVMFLLPIEVSSSGLGAISTGLSVNFVYLYMGILLFLDVFFILNDYNNINSKKYYPIYFLIIIGVLAISIQMIYPSLNYLINPCTVLITFIMYHTIENPDVKMLNELELAKDNAEKANEAKTDFLSSMSHEIRTPLNAIVGFSNSILEDETLEEAKTEAKDIIMASQNLLEIVNGILDISKIEAGKMEIVQVEYNLLDVLTNIKKLIIPRIGEKPIELKTSFSSDIPAIVYGDMNKVREIITNLLTNAVKYTEKGIIDLSVQCINTKNKTKLIISVEDTGRGIKPEKIDKLFTKFQRLEEDKNTTLEGTGLGLAITKSLVEMMGGKIIVQSKYGSGSKFTVYLEQKIIKMIDDKSIATENKNTEEVDYSNKKILIVDDNMLNIKVATRLLKIYQLMPDTALSGQECLEKIKTNHYDLILMDDMMPNMSGTETLQKLKKEDKNFDIPVVVLTANAISGMKEKYLKSGFTDYLAKPIDKLELARVLKEYLENKQ